MVYICGDHERFNRLEDAIRHATGDLEKAGRFIHMEPEEKVYAIMWRRERYLVLASDADEAVRIFCKFDYGATRSERITAVKA